MEATLNGVQHGHKTAVGTGGREVRREDLRMQWDGEGGIKGTCAYVYGGWVTMLDLL